MMQAMQMVNKLISTHALTEGDEETLKAAAVATISTHALTEGDRMMSESTCTHVYFNSRPHGGRQHRAKKVRTRMNISTHALTEGDTFLVILILHFFHFNSRPHGGRPDLSTLCLSCQIFQLTPSRRATGSFCCRYRDGGISTHALTEGDV